MASSEIYRELLVKNRHGLPLWTPDPDEELEEHKKLGISIGDLGILTDDGGFTFYFNVHADADAPINRGMRVPASFKPLQPRPRSTTRRQYHDPQVSIKQNINFTVKGTGGAGANVGPAAGIAAKLNFTTTHERAAFLHLPHGANREDTTALGAYMEYAAKYGESWYKFLNEELKTAASNNSLYLVTGCDKSGSWTLAAGASHKDSKVRLSITAGPPTIASVTAGLNVSWSRTGGMEGRHYPPSPEDNIYGKNQCVFVRGLVIGVRRNKFAAAWKGKVRVSNIDAATASIPGVSKYIPFRSTAGQTQASTDAPRNLAEGLHDLLDQELNELDFYDSQDTLASGVIVQNYPEYPKQVLSPGSYICQHLLSSQPDINLVIVHDNDWMEMTSIEADEIFTTNGPDYECLTAHVLKICHLQITEEMTLLLRRPFRELAMTIEGAIPAFLSVLKDDDSGVRAAGALLVNEFVRQPHLTAVLNDAIPEPASLANLLKYAELDFSSTTSSESIFRLRPLANSGVIVGLPDLQKKAQSSIPHYAAASAITKSRLTRQSHLYTSTDIRTSRGREIFAPMYHADNKEVISDILHSLKDEDGSISKEVIERIADYSRFYEDQATIEEGMPDILNLLQDEHPNIRQAAVMLITKLLEQSELKDDHHDSLLAALRGITEFAKQSKLVMAIKESIPDVLNLLKNDHHDIRQTAIQVITEFLKQSELVMAIKESIPDVLNLLKDDHYDIRLAAMQVITEFAKQSELVMAIKESIPDVLNLLKNDHHDIRQAAIQVITEFAKQSELVMAIKESILDVLDLLKDDHHDIRLAAMQVITEFAKESELVMAIKESIPDVLNLLKDDRHDIRMAAIQAITEFAKQSELVIAIKESIPNVFNLLADKSYSVREAAVSMITVFLKQPELVLAFNKGITNVLNFLKDKDSGIRVATVSLIHSLYQECITLL